MTNMKQSHNTQWYNFNTATDQTSFDMIPKGTLAKVRLTIKPGGFNDLEQGWTGGYATQNPTTGSVYLNCEFVLLEGEYARRRIWSLIGLYSPKVTKEGRKNQWGDIGRSFIKGILNSAYGLHPEDMSETAIKRRCIPGVKVLDGMDFVAKIDVGKDQHGEDKNEISVAITPENPEYGEIMGTIATVSSPPLPAPPPSDVPPWAT